MVYAFSERRIKFPVIVIFVSLCTEKRKIPGIIRFRLRRVPGPRVFCFEISAISGTGNGPLIRQP